MFVNNIYQSVSSLGDYNTAIKYSACLQPISTIKQKVMEATNKQLGGPTTEQLQELVAYAFDNNNRQEIFAALSAQLALPSDRYVSIYKALKVMQAILEYNNELHSSYEYLCSQQVYLLAKQFRYYDLRGINCGYCVRRLAKIVQKLLRSPKSQHNKRDKQQPQQQSLIQSKQPLSNTHASKQKKVIQVFEGCKEFNLREFIRKHEELAQELQSTDSTSQNSKHEASPQNQVFDYTTDDSVFEETSQEAQTQPKYQDELCSQSLLTQTNLESRDDGWDEQYNSSLEAYLQQCVSSMEFKGDVILEDLHVTYVCYT
eukprot:TRINITY_DN5003_c0_g1_i4.p1 TRINITY_DN5003_c0_g1~~TRINITY_DN5003_c0_g1_i4.p1  ORF type:complete len:315 (-),score=23.32 TRINITY_DN5003_c0_g1_i4:508-1452(-)